MSCATHVQSARENAQSAVMLSTNDRARCNKVRRGLGRIDIPAGALRGAGGVLAARVWGVAGVAALARRHARRARAPSL
eukprot:4984235-Pleurochrysis_carterae.AAC.1